MAQNMNRPPIDERLLQEAISRANAIKNGDAVTGDYVPPRDSLVREILQGGNFGPKGSAPLPDNYYISDKLPQGPFQQTPRPDFSRVGNGMWNLQDKLNEILNSPEFTHRNPQQNVPNNLEEFVRSVTQNMPAYLLKSPGRPMFADREGSNNAQRIAGQMNRYPDGAPPRPMIPRAEQGQVRRVSPGLYRNDAGKLVRGNTSQDAMRSAYGAPKQQSTPQPALKKQPKL